MSYRLFLALLALVTTFSCRSVKPDATPVASTPVVLPKAVSSANIPIILPLSYLEENINKDWSSRLFSDKGLPLASGILADLDVVRRGRITLQAAPNNTLRVKVPMNLKGDIKIEKKVFGQVMSSTVPFNEMLAPEISFVPEIGRNWELSIKNVTIENWGRSMKYNFLGFEVDLDPIIRNQLQKALDNQLKATNFTKLDFRKVAQETWRSFAEPYSFDQEGLLVHFYSLPKQLKVRQELTEDQKLSLYLGIEGEVFSQVGTKPTVKLPPLPPIQLNDNKSNFIDIQLPLVIKHGDLDAFLNKTMAGQPIRTDKKTVFVPTNMRTSKYGDKMLLAMDFKAIRNNKMEVKGEVFLAGKPVYDEAKQQLVFEDLEFDMRTGHLPAKLAINANKGKILSEIRKMAKYPLANYIKEAKQAMQQQGYFETDFATFRVKNPDLKIKGLYTTEEDIRLYVQSTGQMDIQLKNLR